MTTIDHPDATALDLQRWERWLRLVDATGDYSYLRHRGDAAGHARWLEDLSTAISISADAFQWKGRRLDILSLKLNTALGAGGNPPEARRPHSRAG